MRGECVCVCDWGCGADAPAGDAEGLEHQHHLGRQRVALRPADSGLTGLTVEHTEPGG